MRDLLSIADLDRAQIEALLDGAEHMADVLGRDIPKVPALRGKTVVSLFYEDSTRTRLSFETAAKRLGADTMTFTLGTSSVKKGESLLDTARTIEAMGVDAMVVRHSAAGAPHRVAGWVDAAVVNAGDGRHEHPTQALLDAFTLRRHRGPGLDGARIAIVGDVRNSRVARSGIACWHRLGAQVTLVGPPTLMPERLDGWPVAVSHDLDDVLTELDVVYVLRVQQERLGQALLPSLREYYARYGVTTARSERMKPDALVMHPGPMIRGPEIATEVVDGGRSLIREQVANGVAVRMAVLWDLIGSGGRLV
ncbi:MAG: aspartate carbamoyltransferase catalytic subunit [Actinobacteria bacterium]|nr:aspartate carbamoyltransferase catalytic subunit [Actinomycetota bacterium]